MDGNSGCCHNHTDHRPLDCLDGGEMSGLSPRVLQLQVFVFVPHGAVNEVQGVLLADRAAVAKELDVVGGGSVLEFQRDVLLQLHDSDVPRGDHEGLVQGREVGSVEDARSRYRATRQQIALSVLKQGYKWQDHTHAIK